MSNSLISLGLGFGGGKASTSNGRIGGATSFTNTYSVSFDGTNDAMALGNLGSAGRSLGAMLFWVNVTSTDGIRSNSNIGVLSKLTE